MNVQILHICTGIHVDNRLKSHILNVIHVTFSIFETFCRFVLFGIQMPIDPQSNKDQTVKIYLIPQIGRFFKNLHCCSPPEPPFSNWMSEFKNVLVMH